MGDINNEKLQFLQLFFLFVIFYKGVSASKSFLLRFLDKHNLGQGDTVGRNYPPKDTRHNVDCRPCCGGSSVPYAPQRPHKGQAPN